MLGICQGPVSNVPEPRDLSFAIDRKLGVPATAQTVPCDRSSAKVDVWHNAL